MKKFKIVFLAIAALIIFTGCGKSNLKSISYSKLNNMIKNEETFFFVVIRDGCSHCEDYLPKLDSILKDNDITGYTINLADMSKDDLNSFDEEFNVDGTPTTIFIANGKETSIMQRIDGDVSKEKIINKLTANNYIKK